LSKAIESLTFEASRDPACPSSPPAQPPPQPEKSASISGDPHLFGGEGDRIDFKGEHGAVYVLHSARRLALNGLFENVSFEMGCVHCSRKTVHGSLIRAVYFRALTSSGKTLTVEYKADEPSIAHLVTQNAGEEELGFLATKRNLGVSSSMPDAEQDRTDDVSVTLARKHKREAVLTVSNGHYELAAASRYIGYAELNGHKKRLDVSILPLEDVARSAVSPHGLLGQTFDSDGVAVDGALDDYSGKVVVTKAMGEGAIEGVPGDYKLPANDPFSAKFKYSRFEALAAPPRDASKLTGVRREVGRHASAAARSEGDDVMDMGGDLPSKAPATTALTNLTSPEASAPAEEAVALRAKAQPAWMSAVHHEQELNELRALHATAATMAATEIAALKEEIASLKSTRSVHPLNQGFDKEKGSGALK